MDKIDPTDLLSISQAATVRNVSRQAINHLVIEGKLKFVEIGGKKFISRKDLAGYEPDKGGRPKKTKG